MGRRSRLAEVDSGGASRAGVVTEAGVFKDQLSGTSYSLATTRALYCSDEVYVGWAQRGDVIEMFAADPHLGAVFNTVEQEPTDIPRIRRQTDHCLACYASVTTGIGHPLAIYATGTGFPRIGFLECPVSSLFSDRLLVAIGVAGCG